MKQTYLLKSFIFLVSVLLGIGVVSCKKPTDPDNTPGFSLTVEDVSCIEAWVRVKSAGLKLPAEIIITKNKIPALSFTMATADTVVMIDSLLPKQSYTFQALRSDNIKATALAQCTTMDTTSHNFTWQSFLFGEGSYNTFDDATIIDENSIWAVGNITVNDSNRNYNAVHWDGTRWTLKRILYQGGLWEIPTLFAFSGNDIWYSGYMRFNGLNFIELPIPNILIGWSISKLWGTSSHDLYAVGFGGNIVHYNGSSWTKLESGTTWDLLDVFGYQNPETAKVEALVASTDNENYSNSMLLKISENKVQKITVSTGREIGSVWTQKGFPVYIDGKGVFSNKAGTWKKVSIGADFTTSKIRGNGLNDIFVCGVFGLISHYNGYKWQPFYLGSDIVYRSIFVTPNLIVAVGDKGNKAVITVGKR